MIKIKNILNKKTDNYFKEFSKKNLANLNLMFSKDIVLNDWTIKIKGKNKVLKFNERLFKKFKKIEVKVVEKFIHLKNKKVICEIKVRLNKKIINVIDIIYFNKNYKIKKIKAYLG